MPSGAFSINRGSVASVPYVFEDSTFPTMRMKFAEGRCPIFGCLRCGSSDAFGSVFFFSFSVWELCFSLVSPLWESCYSLAFG